jgi:hypothetical protein
MGRGINGGDPRLRGEEAVYAAKARCEGLDGEHDGNSLRGLRNPALLLLGLIPMGLDERKPSIRRFTPAR